MRWQHWLNTVPLRLRSLFGRGKVEQELDEEFQYHLEMKTQECLAKGATPEEARWTVSSCARNSAATLAGSA